MLITQADDCLHINETVCGHQSSVIIVMTGTRTKYSQLLHPSVPHAVSCCYNCDMCVCDCWKEELVNNGLLLSDLTTVTPHNTLFKIL